MNLHRKPGGIARAPSGHGAAQQSRFEDGRPGRQRTQCAQTLTARPPWHDGLTSKPAPLSCPGSPQAERAAPQARKRQRSAPDRVETHGGSMCNTRARSGRAGDARNRQTSKPLLIKLDEEQNLLYFSTTIRQSTKQQNRLCDEYGEVQQMHMTRPKRPATHRDRKNVRCRTRQSAPPKRGAGATLSRPCCATRSGCACRPRLRPGGHRSSPGTTDRPASPRGTDARHG